MHTWADVWSADGSERLGASPAALVEASFTRRLDGVGDFRLKTPLAEMSAGFLIPDRRVIVYASDGSTTRELGRGIIRRVRQTGSAAGWMLTVEGADELDALTRRSTLLGRTYANQTPIQIAESLVDLVDGWSASGSGGNATDARFDGVSIWRALLWIAEAQGLHIRAGDDPNTVEIGAFGDLADLRLTAGGEYAIIDQGNIGLIERLTVEHDTDAAATRLYPVGAGIGDALLTLANSTRSSPYTIESVSVNDVPQFYIQDAAGVSAFGVIEKVGKFRQIAPLSNSAGDLTNAANALYDLAAAWLSRYSQPYTSYRVVCRKVRQTVRVGDKVRLSYKGVIDAGTGDETFIDIDADLWVLDVTEHADADGLATIFTLSSVDRHPHDSAQVVIGALEAIDVDGVSVKPYFNRTAWVYDRLIDPATPAIIPVRFTDATQRLTRCVLRVKTRPFTATATAAGGGGITGLQTSTAGDHTHGIGESTATSLTPYFWREIEIGSHLILIPTDSESGAVELATESAGGHYHAFSVPDHTHDLVYGLYADTITPNTVRVYVNGDDWTSALGGAWAVGGGSTTFDIDITAAILAANNLQQEHEIKLTCQSGRGSVEVSVEVYEVIMSVAVAST